MTTPNKAQHTPGPWRVGSRGSYHQRHYIEIMADVPLRGKRNGVTMEMPVCEVGINEADAHLIAAAPELLEACKTLVGLVKKFDLTTPDGQVIEGKYLLKIQDADIAIAKAEGRAE